ncbi:uncharacterized protein L969DRAFT_86000 [Mixia osmundae IAM 14324]|uniref:Activator of Hsp90 ATPase AHSA1-like N-terminal domain-containing protein n=1 Tax=Mixia osmundae (strain CBS 9802 / IAM 14324 / JCM 22182 / KY 12970) TaxID=764103 RepID=G7E5H0_MIXOS|nr:uncharacterized protein L969DRAFT_86000 [Mixia osmundae IAM 14324]KEI40769.1 hypothetical protein L969DRAFT_86000 [Mixia osmundae IAM 14324]GAA98080.1 hypothetical protein E5Q_04762 [Mixia osmundae IAM 14324]
MTLSAGLKNWHWRSKNTKSWAQTWFEQHLVGLESEGVKIESIREITGDSDIGMRKSKLVTIYDLNIVCRWISVPGGPDEDEVSGTLTALEVCHDMSEEEYTFESTLDQSEEDSKRADKLHTIAKTKLADLCRPQFQQFPKSMIDVHGKDLLQAAEDEDAKSKGQPAAPAPKLTTAAAAAKPATSSKSINTAVVTLQEDLRIQAVELFELLTDPTKVPQWTRNVAQIEPVVGAPVSLFGGNIVGKVLAVDKPERFVQTWRAPTWPDDHYGELEIKLQQGSDTTNLSLRLTGCPVGKEDETKHNLEGFYMRSLKAIGLGTML